MPLGATEQAPGAIRTAASRDDPPAPLQTPQTGAQRKAAMSTAHLDQMRENRQRDAARAVHNELLQLAIRRIEHRTEEEAR